MANLLNRYLPLLIRASRALTLAFIPRAISFRAGHRQLRISSPIIPVMGSPGRTAPACGLPGLSLARPNGWFSKNSAKSLREMRQEGKL